MDERELYALLQDLQGSIYSPFVRQGHSKNFLKWRREMTMSLTDTSLWEDIVTANTPAADQDPAWVKKNNQAMLELASLTNRI